MYLLPSLGDGLTPATAFRPAYTDGLRSDACDYGREGWFVVVADVTNAQHTAIAAHPDATALPADLDQPIGAALAIVQAKLEAANIPADWVTSGMTYRTMLKWVLRIILLMQRFRGFDNAAARLFAAVTLDSTIGDLSAAVRQRLNTAATSFGLDTSSIALSTTIRAALRILGQQMTFDVSLNGIAA